MKFMINRAINKVPFHNFQLFNNLWIIEFHKFCFFIALFPSHTQNRSKPSSPLQRAHIGPAVVCAFLWENCVSFCANRKQTPPTGSWLRHVAHWDRWRKIPFFLQKLNKTRVNWGGYQGRFRLKENSSYSEPWGHSLLLAPLHSGAL